MSVNQEFVRSMRNKYRSYLQPSGNMNDVLSGKDVNQFAPADGFTGRGPGGNTQLDKPAGIVHQGEYVIDAAEVNNMGGPSGVKNAINSAQINKPQGFNPSKRFDPSQDPTKGLSMGSRGPQPMQPRPSRAPIGSPTKLPGFADGGLAGMTGAGQLTESQRVRQLFDTNQTNRNTINPTTPPEVPDLGDISLDKPKEGVLTQTFPGVPDKPLDVELYKPPPPPTEPPPLPSEEDGIKDSIDETLTKVDDIVTKGRGRLDAIETKIDAPEIDPDMADPSDLLLDWKKDFGDLTILPESERSKMYAMIEDMTADRYQAIAEGRDPIFEQLSEREKDTLTGVLNANRGKQSQLAAQLGMSGGELNAHYAKISRDQELMSLGLTTELAKQQMARIDHANDQLAKMSSDVQTREDATRKWGSEFNLALANFGLGVENYNALRKEFAANYIKDYAKMGLEANIATQANQLQLQALYNDFDELSVNAAKWGTDMATKMFLENRTQHMADAQVLLSLNTPESIVAAENLLKRYYPELNISTDLLESVYSSRWRANVSDLIVGVKAESYTDIQSYFGGNGNGFITEDAMGKASVTAAIKMWNAQNQLSSGDEGYIDPNDFLSLRRNVKAHEEISNMIKNENTKRTPGYFLTADMRPSQLFGLVDGFGTLDDNGDFVPAFGSIDEFKYNGITGITAIREWFGEAFQNNVIYLDENGDIKVDDEDAIMSAWNLPGLGTEKDLNSNLTKDLEVSGGWPTGVDKSKPIMITNERTGLTTEYKYGDERTGSATEFKYGDEIPIGDTLTYTQDGKSISLDKNYLAWRKENPNTKIGTNEPEEPKEPSSIDSTDFSKVLNGTEPLTTDFIKSVTPEQKTAFKEDYDLALKNGKMDHSTFIKGIIANEVQSITLNAVPTYKLAKAQIDKGNAFVSIGGQPYELVEPGRTTVTGGTMEHVGLKSQDGTIIWKTSKGGVYLTKPTDFIRKSTKYYKMTGQHGEKYGTSDLGKISITTTQYNDPEIKQVFDAYAKVYQTIIPDNNLPVSIMQPLFALTEFFQKGMDVISKENLKIFTDNIKISKGGYQIIGTDYVFNMDENKIPYLVT